VKVAVDPGPVCVFASKINGLKPLNPTEIGAEDCPDDMVVSLEKTVNEVLPLSEEESEEERRSFVL